MLHELVDVLFIGAAGLPSTSRSSRQSVSRVVSRANHLMSTIWFKIISVIIINARPASSGKPCHSLPPSVSPRRGWRDPLSIAQ